MDAVFPGLRAEPAVASLGLEALSKSSASWLKSALLTYGRAATKLIMVKFRAVFFRSA
jgi:hypothetical protein